METLTITLEVPTHNSPYFVIALYNRQPGVINELNLYRVNLKRKRIERRYDPENEWMVVKD